MLAIVFLGITKEKFDKRRCRNILVVLVITLLTTMSTTGYVLLPLCLLFHLRGINLTARHVPKMLEQYADFDYVIGMRFHSAVFGCVTGVPTGAVIYHPKVRYLVKNAVLTLLSPDLLTLTANH